MFEVAIVLHYLINIYTWIVIASGFVIFFRPKHPALSGIIHLVVVLTYPVLNFLRTRLPLSYGGMDFAPLVLVVALIVLDKAIVSYISSAYF